MHIEAAMSGAITMCSVEGVTDTAEIKAAMMAARQSVVDEARAAESTAY